MRSLSRTNRRLVLIAVGCFLLTAVALLIPVAALHAQSQEGLERLTPAQRQALQSEILRNKGELSPEMLEKLRAAQEKPQTQEQTPSEPPRPGAEEVRQLNVNRAAAEKGEKQFEEKTSEGQLRRYGFDSFSLSRKRILVLEEAISKGEIPSAVQKDALAGFVGPLDMVSASLNASIPAQYAINPGDQVTVYYWGDLIELISLKLKIDENGEVSIPQAGRLVVRGMSLAQFQKAIQDQLQRVFGKNINLIATLDKLRSMQIFITGEAFRPGSYAVSSVTTLFNALYACGGPNESGSLRDIKLVRNNKTMTVDFYDFLLNGDGRSDHPLQAGDTIFITRAGKLVSLAGEVGRPAVYELKENEGLRDLVGMANGIKPSGLTNKVLIQSVIPHRERIVIDVDMSRNALAADQALFDRDTVLVEAILPEITNRVTLTGDVKVPGTYELKKNMRIADLFNEVNEPLGDALLERTVVIRLDRDRRTTTAIPINLKKALQKDPDHNIELASLDRIVVYSKWDVKFYPAKIVEIQGSVQRPGFYQRSEGMRIQDLLSMAGGTLPGSVNEITISKARFYSEPKLFTVKADLLEKGDESQNVLLDDEDIVMVRSDSGFFLRPQWVAINGEVKYPGNYPLMGKQYRLSGLIQQAGGLTKAANPKGTVFLRKSEFLPSPEQKADLLRANDVSDLLNKIDYLRQSARNALLLRSEAAKSGAGETPLVVGAGGIPITTTNASAKEAVGLAMTPTIAQSAGQATGSIVNAFTPGSGVTTGARTLTDRQLAQSTRVVLNLEKGMQGGTGNPDDIVLMNGDTITVPSRQETVSVVGAVMSPVTTRLGGHNKISEIVSLAGGYAKDADQEGVLIVRVDGSMVTAEDDGPVEEGDIIYVPAKVLTTEIVTTTDKIINAFKFTLATIASVVVFLALIH
ncbi:MAG: SLBB domain-containing protein [Nitrospirae bacterium]|nr:SLBB domain-containing protein [Nitrospirota bacterium]